MRFLVAVLMSVVFLSPASARVRGEDFKYERRWAGDKNRGYQEGKPYEYHRSHDRNRRSRQR